MPENSHEHKQVKVISRCADCGNVIDEKVFDRADVQPQQMTDLPDREAMSLVNADVAAPINAALALNVLSDGSLASASATQYTPIQQTAG